MVTLRSSGPVPSDDQRQIVDAYFDGGRLVVDAGAGTGKTSTLVRILARTILDNFGANQNANPLERVLAITFGVEASREIKSKLRIAIKDHFDLKGPLVDGGPPPTSTLTQEFWRFFETESNIQTIDALFMSLLREIATFLRIPPTFNIPKTIDLDGIVDGAISTIRKDRDIDAKWLKLEDYYSFERRWGNPSDIRNIIWAIHQKMREFCWSPSDVRSKLVEGLDTVLYCGKTPPNSFPEVTQILTMLAGATAQIVTQDQDQTVSYVKSTYELNKQLANDFADLIQAFDAEYDKVSRQSGSLTHIDIAYHVWKYSTDPMNQSWRSSLRRRFDHILVDEFQDTSYVQYNVLLKFISQDPPNRVVFIGDVKQSIYQWRSADPTIFARLISESSSSPPKESEGIGKLEYFALKTNFRSHPQLIHFFNGIFSQMFSQPQRGMIDIQVPYTRLRPPSGMEFARGTRIHVLRNMGVDMAGFTGDEAEELTSVIHGILAGGLQVRDKETGKQRLARPGDVGVLFRRNRYVQSYVDELRRAGLKVAVLTDTSLFSEPEISLIVDLFDWLANPDSKDPLLRVLRSPLIAISDETLRYLASKNFILYLARDPWPESLSQSEKKKLEELIDLRNDLRWDREGRKSELLERIIAFCSFDSVVLAGTDGLQAQANLWQLVEYVTALEEEELIGYGRFVEILKLLRDRAASEEERDYPSAIMALPRSEDTITVMTVHGAKGLEYPILVIAECASHAGTQAHASQFIAHRTRGLLLKPQPPDMVQPFQIVPAPGERPIPWVTWGEQGALLWVSDRRDTSGQLARNSAIDSELRAEFSEFWRLLYVAATRARDHIIFSIAANPKFRSDKWDAWMPYLRDSVGFLEDAIGELPRMAGLTENGAQVEITVGFDDLTRIPVQERAKPALVNWGAIKYSGSPRKIPPFIPRSINPSNFLDLLLCPRRYQYEALWEVTGVRFSPMTHTKGPAGIDPDEWGVKVHSLLEDRQFALPPEDDTRTGDILQLNLSDNRRSQEAKELALALGNFESSAIATRLVAALHEKKEPLREHPFAYSVSADGYPSIEIKGKIDLAFEAAPGEWWVIDYKTEARPIAGSYLDRLHRTQIDAYASALRKIYGYNVVKGVVAYLYPTFSPDEFVPDPDGFESSVKQAIAGLEMDKKSIKGLVARPNLNPGQICSFCPYSGKKGGPCEHYN